MSVDIRIEGKDEGGLNYANANFARLWELVGPCLKEDGEVRVWLLEALIQNCMLALNSRASYERPRVETRGEGGATMIECGEPDDRMRERIQDVMKLAIEARVLKRRILFS